MDLSHKPDKTHINIANAIAWIMLIAYGFARWLHLVAHGQGHLVPRFFLASAVTGVLMGLSMFLVKKSEVLALLMPGSLVAGIFLFIIIGAGVDHLFLVLFSLCAVSGAYFSLRYYLWFVAFVNAVVFVALVIIGYPLEGPGIPVETLYLNWAMMFLWTCIVYLTVRYAKNRRSKSNMSMESFLTMLDTTPNMVALLDDHNRVRYISRELALMANIERVEFAARRPFLDLFSSPDMAEMVADILDMSHDCEDTVKVNMDGTEKYFKIISVWMKGAAKGRLIDITDVTPIMKARYEAESASRAKSDFLTKMSHEIRTPMNAILGMAELVLREGLPPGAKEQVLTIKQSGGHMLSIINDILDFSKIESGKLEILNTDYFFQSLVNDVLSIIKTRMEDSNVSFAAYIQRSIPNELIGDEVRLRQVLINILSNAVKYTKEGFIALDIFGEMDGDVSEGIEGIVVLKIRIKDTGIGIKPEDMKQLFEEFVRFDLENNRGIEGTGLGLGITHNLLKLMGGKIEAESRYGEGSEFVITLPQKYRRVQDSSLVERPEEKRVLLYLRTPVYLSYLPRSLADLEVEYSIAPDENELRGKLLEGSWGFVFAEGDLAFAAKEIISAHNLSSKVVQVSNSWGTDREFSALVMPAYFVSIANILNNRSNQESYGNHQTPENFTAPEVKILVVDDIATNLMVVEGLLEPFGLNADFCESGKEAVEAVKVKDYDLILMDHMMPEMDGVEAVRIIREMGGAFAALPIIALTANAIIGAKEMFLQNGFNDFLSKPIDIPKLNSVLAKWLPKDKQKQADS